jgi:hypothetical protein
LGEKGQRTKYSGSSSSSVISLFFGIFIRETCTYAREKQRESKAKGVDHKRERESKKNMGNYINNYLTITI